MNKSTFFERIKEGFGFLPISEVSTHLDLGGDTAVFLWHIDGTKDRKVIAINKELFPSVFNGQIENSENFLRELSFVSEMNSLTKIKIPAIFESRQLYLTTRQETPQWQKEIVKRGSYQYLFDNCFFSSHEKIFSDLIIKKFGESYNEFGFLRFYNNEIFVNTSFDSCYRTDVSPDLFIFALKEFLENKYRVIIKNEKIQSLLEHHFQHNPKSVGKKNIKYELEVLGLNNERKLIVPTFGEISDALRPITKATLHKLRSLVIPSQNIFYFYSDITWIKKFLGLVSLHFEQNTRIKFIDITEDKVNFFLDYNTN